MTKKSKDKPEVRPEGRPSKYTKEIAQKICDMVASSSKGISAIAAELNLTPSTIFKWLSENKEFSELYAHAKVAQSDVLADEIIAIADATESDTKIVYKDGKPTEVENTEWVNRSKLRVDARKWVASKLKPRVYGDKLDVIQTIREQPLFGDDINAE